MFHHDAWAGDYYRSQPAGGTPINLSHPNQLSDHLDVPVAGTHFILFLSERRAIGRSESMDGIWCSCSTKI